MEHKVGIIGHFGGNKDFYDGQTVKTKNLAKLLEMQEGISVFKVDTYYAKGKKPKLLLDTIICLLTCKHVFLLVSVNGMNFYLRFLYYLNRITRCHIYHYIIGSGLLELVRRNKNLVKYLNALDKNWFEYESGTQELRAAGVTNAVTLANFKLLQPVSSVKEYDTESGIYRFCTFSRVMEEKGITDAIAAIRDINTASGKLVALLDVYGPVEERYAGTFERLLSENAGYVSYKGVVSSEKSVETLSDYFALLFPTAWGGEGVPGTLIDAFASGIPVIASDWNANKELIRDREQGILYPNSYAKTLRDAIEWAVRNCNEMNKMRKKSRDEYDRYAPHTVLNVILEEIEEKRKC